MRVGDNGLHLFERILRGLRVVPFREHASGGADLDEVSAVLDRFADLVLYGFDAIGYAFRGLMVGDGEQIIVAVATGDAERRAANLHVRTLDQSFVDGVAEVYVRVTLSADVAHRGEA